MIAVAYHYAVLPRHQGPFRFAYRSAREALQQTLGLLSHEFHEPRERRQTFTLRLAWDSQTSFERFTRSWIGVWLLNGMGLDRSAFAAPIQTDMGEESAPYLTRSGRRAA